MEINVSIANSLSVKRSELPPKLEEMLREYLSLPNGAKEKAVALGEWGAREMPDFIDLWNVDGDELLMPRGFAWALNTGLESLGHKAVWDDHTVRPQFPLQRLVALKRVAAREYQEPIVQAMLDHRQGIVEAPSAGGKTVVGLEAFRRIGCRALILTDKADLAHQWQARAIEHIGVKPGLLRGPSDQWSREIIDVGMIQTLNRYIQRLGAPASDDYGLIIVDECHHAIAETWRRVISWFRPAYLFGMTATPLEGDWTRPILEAVLGPVIHATERDTLRQAQVLARPEIHVVDTSFKWVAEGADRRLRDSRVIYKRIIEALEHNEERNRLIAERIVIQPDDASQIINSDRIDHLRRLMLATIAAGYPEDRAWLMTGRESKEERDRIKREAMKGGCAIFSTLAKEGLDVPRLDRLHMAWPVRKSLRVKQLVGRIERLHQDKTRALVFDYADFKQGVLRSQFFSRLTVYREHGYPIFGLKGGPE